MNLGISDAGWRRFIEGVGWMGEADMMIEVERFEVDVGGVK